ncbi:MAG: peptidylprolyl isomerase, partial [candidate division NC10 bacterium]
LKRVKDQFKDDAAFNENLQKSSMTLENLRKQIQSQVDREALILSAMSLSVSTSEAKEFFDANKDKLGVQESVHVRHILVSDEQKAKDLLIAIRVGADFVRLAQEVSADTGLKERGGDLGFVSRGMLQADIEKVVFSLKPGEVSDVVKSPLGYHIFKAEERRETKPAVYAEVERDLLQALLAQKMNRAWPVYIKQLRDAAMIVPAPGVPYAPPKPAGAN